MFTHYDPLHQKKLNSLVVGLLLKCAGFEGNLGGAIKVTEVSHYPKQQVSGDCGVFAALALAFECLKVVYSDTPKLDEQGPQWSKYGRQFMKTVIEKRQISMDTLKALSFCEI